MMNENTRSYYKNEIMKCVLSLLENEQSIPLSSKSFLVEGIGEVATSMVTKAENLFMLDELDESGTGYKSIKITKQVALEKIQRQFNKMSKEKLKEELEYWKECSDFFDAETKNSMFFIENKKASIIEAR